VVGAFQDIRDFLKPGMFEEGSGTDLAKQAAQFPLDDFRLDIPQYRGGGPIDLAVNTVKIADLVRIKVDADRDAF
ncbi:MAG TPA: hypothetical protein DIU35_11515, partial [Candidatus Latescibacteria bacterium]|nr:hypothetical protein [Candidatus Latescibacterota bacterium]